MKEELLSPHDVKHHETCGGSGAVHISCDGSIQSILKATLPISHTGQTAAGPNCQSAEETAAERAR